VLCLAGNSSKLTAFVFGKPAGNLNQRMLYTALTRASCLLLVVASPAAISRMWLDKGKG